MPAITDTLYNKYMTSLLKGDRNTCAQIIIGLLDKKIDIKILYLELFQKSLYQVGQLWELNEISVGREHLSTALSENLLTLVYPYLFTNPKKNKKVIISCSTDEFHQVGGKIVADYFEINGWNSHFIGANTPVNHLLAYIDEIKPDLVGLSLSVYFNMPSLKKTISSIHSDFPQMDLIVGGQAFRFGGKKIILKYPNTELITSLELLDNIL